MIARNTPSTQARDKGAVLLTTLLVMSLMATVAVSLFDGVRFAVKRSINAQSFAQADWYISSSDDIIRAHVAEPLKQVKQGGLALNDLITSQDVIPVRLDNGTVNLTIYDGGRCFSLGALGTSPGRIQFRQLLEALGWDTLRAAALTSQAVDWIDSDSAALPDGAEDGVYLSREPAYRTANAPFNSVAELRSLASMDEPDYQRLKPYLCARNPDVASRINVNMLTPVDAPLLASVLMGRDSLEIANRLISERPTAGYESLAQLRAAPALAGQSAKDANLSVIDFSPRYIVVNVDVSVGPVTRHAQFEYDVSDQDLILLSRRLGLDERRPALVKETR